MDHRDISAINQLICLYGHAADATSSDLLGQVFTEDAVIDARPCGDALVEGLPAIEKWFGMGKPPHPPSHHTTNIYVYEEGGDVRVRSKWFVINRTDGTGVSGDYDDVVVRAGDDWRISSRLITPRFPQTIDFSHALAASSH